MRRRQVVLRLGGRSGHATRPLLVIPNIRGACNARYAKASITCGRSELHQIGSELPSLATVVASNWALF